MKASRLVAIFGLERKSDNHGFSLSDSYRAVVKILPLSAQTLHEAYDTIRAARAESVLQSHKGAVMVLWARSGTSRA